MAGTTMRTGWLAAWSWCTLWGSVVRAEPAPTMAWSAIRTPTRGPARAVGRYAAGCVEGAVRLPLRGDGFRVARPERGRLFGHPTLVALVRDLGARVRAARLGALSIGDLAQPRGGPAPSGHASHQNGLDVDIWYAPPPQRGPPRSMIDARQQRPSRHLSRRVMRVLELGAADPRVDRIFVHPIVKRALCQAAQPHSSRLRKIRPWWGHHDHFHVRLACPSDSPACEPQPALPPQDGCNELDWWFSSEAQHERDQEHKAYASKVGALPELPEQCRALASSP